MHGAGGHSPGQLRRIAVRVLADITSAHGVLGILLAACSKNNYRTRAEDTP